MPDRPEIPCDPHAEQMLIATCLRSADAIDEASWLKPEEFFTAYAAAIWEAMLSLRSDGADVSPSSIYAWLVRADKDLDVSVARMVELHGLWTSGSAESNAVVVHSHFLRRELAKLAREIHAEALRPGDSASSPIEFAERGILALAERNAADSGPVTMANIMEETLTELQDRKSGKNEGPLATGYGNLDRLIGGFEGGEFIIIAARPSVGKTAFALNLLARMCRSGPMLFISLEQSKKELGRRLLARESGIDGYRIKMGRTSNPDDNAIAFASQRLNAMPWHVHFDRTQTIRRIGSTVRRYRRRFGIKAVVIDYLQLIVPDDAKMPRQEQVQNLTRIMKIIAGDSSVPVIALAQLNREVESRPDSKPRLSDLRESGAIEQDADIVLMLHEERKDSSEFVDPTIPTKLEIIIAKNRDGSRGSALMNFQKNTMRIDEQEIERSGPEWMK